MIFDPKTDPDWLRRPAMIQDALDEMKPVLRSRVWNRFRKMAGLAFFLLAFFLILFLVV